MITCTRKGSQFGILVSVFYVVIFVENNIFIVCRIGDDAGIDRPHLPIAEPAAVAAEVEIAVVVGITKFSPEVVLNTSEV